MAGSSAESPDRRKGNYITRRGWDLLRFTWHGLYE
jgi:hypothetical protein